jgi:calcium-dependent protein kinase
VKIIDFGLSAKINKEQTTLGSRVGTPYYIAPEVIKG